MNDNEKRRTKRVAIAGLPCDSNQGDVLILQTVELLLQREAARRGVEVKYEELNLRDENYGMPTWQYVGFLVKNKLRRMLPQNALNLRWQIAMQMEAYRHLPQDLCGAVVAGGGLMHFRFHPYVMQISALVGACNRRQLPVVINSVGIEEYAPRSKRFAVYKRYLNLPAVKRFTVRDNLEALRRDFVAEGSTMETDLVPDNAILAAQMMGIERQEDSQLVGVGLVRSNIYDEYYGERRAPLLTDRYEALLRQLDAEGTPWELFTTGVETDNDLVPELERRLGRRLTVRTPQTPRQLVELIATYQGIIAARMHACITAYSLGVPFVAIAWLQKIPKFCELVGRPTMHVKLEDATPDRLLALLREAMATDYDAALRTQLTHKIEENIRRMADCLSL